MPYGFLNGVLNQQRQAADSPYVVDFTDANSTLIPDYTPPSPITYGTVSSTTHFHIYNNSFANRTGSGGNVWALWELSNFPQTGTITADLTTHITSASGMQALCFGGTTASPWNGVVLALRAQQFRFEGSILGSYIDYPYPFTDSTLYLMRAVWDDTNVYAYINDELIATRPHGGATFNSAFGYNGWYTTGATSNQTLMDNIVIIDGAAAVPLSWDWSTYGDAPSFDQRFGMRFTVGDLDYKVNTLGFYGFGQVVSSENVRIHRWSDGALIAEATVTSITNGAWASTSIPEVTLSSGVDYIVSHRAGGTPRSVARNPTDATYDPNLTAVGSYFGTDDNKPTSSSGNTYLAARFEYV